VSETFKSTPRILELDNVDELCFFYSVEYARAMERETVQRADLALKLPGLERAAERRVRARLEIGDGSGDCSYATGGGGGECSEERMRLEVMREMRTDLREKLAVKLRATPSQHKASADYKEGKEAAAFVLAGAVAEIDAAIAEREFDMALGELDECEQCGRRMLDGGVDGRCMPCQCEGGE
jgi:hypothetical protein